MWTNSKVFDKDKNILVLKGDYIFSYTKFDGFCERLLGAEMLIDHDFNYIFQMEAFQHEKITINKSNFFIENGRLPEGIFTYLEQFLESDFQNLNESYEEKSFVMTDVGRQFFTINFDSQTFKRVEIINGLPIEYFQNETELLLFEFNEYLKEYSKINITIGYLKQQRSNKNASLDLSSTEDILKNLIRK